MEDNLDRDYNLVYEVLDDGREVRRFVLRSTIGTYIVTTKECGVEKGICNGLDYSWCITDHWGRWKIGR